MKEWFPFTSYDFYAYITAGMIVIVAADYAFVGSQLISRKTWDVPSGAFWAALAYMGGQIIAGPSALILEHWIVRDWLGAPTEVVLGLKKPPILGRLVAALAGAREYTPFPTPVIAKIVTNADTALSQQSASPDVETIFNLAYSTARQSADSAARLDGFINLYGLCRNVSFALFVAGAFLIYRYWKMPDEVTAWLLAGAYIGAVLLFGRFLKFYSAFAREAFRALIR